MRLMNPISPSETLLHRHWLLYFFDWMQYVHLTGNFLNFIDFRETARELYK